MRIENQNGASVDHVFCLGAVQRLGDGERGRCCLLQSQAEAADPEKLNSCSVQISLKRSLISCSIKAAIFYDRDTCSGACNFYTYQIYVYS
jgi:hypothetical protein